MLNTKLRVYIYSKRESKNDFGLNLPYQKFLLSVDVEKLIFCIKKSNTLLAGCLDRFSTIYNLKMKCSKKKVLIALSMISIMKTILQHEFVHYYFNDIRNNHNNPLWLTVRPLPNPCWTRKI
jgi:hypothetical protein